MIAKTSMQHRGLPLANAAAQLGVLAPEPSATTFAATLRGCGIQQLSATRIDILQANLGKLCNMTCSHCHVDAGPDRRELMSLTTIQSCLGVLKRHPEIHTLDLTGGAPEMNPHFREMVQSARDMDRQVIDRCNLTILLAKGYENLPEFLAGHGVEIVASLPCYLEENTDAQRGDGTFDKSIRALQRLNQLGYGNPNGKLTLTLVYNPVGTNLPPDQADLELAYRHQLQSRFGIRFNRLFTITNMPVSRYLEQLLKSGQYANYMDRLIQAFNPAAVEGLMCRNTLSVGWDGRIYDCDFNQMLELTVAESCGSTIDQFDYQRLCTRAIVTGQHCFGCTAGQGSGCQGAIA